MTTIINQLSEPEKRALARYYLGGVQALRTPTHSVACSTISALVRRGLLDTHGLTAEGRVVGRALADAGVI